MQSENNHKTTQLQQARKKTKTIILSLVLALAVVLILSVLFFVPAFVSSEKGRKIILTKINNSIDGRTDFATLSMGWLKGFKVTDFSFNDNTGQTSVAVRQITTKPHYASFLLGSLSFGKTIIDEPEVQINLKVEQAVEAPQKKILPEQKPKLPMPPIKQIDLIVNDGSLKVTDQQDNTAELSQISSNINLRPPGRQTNFDVNLTVVNKGKRSQVHTAGNVKPKRTKTGWSLKGTSGDLTVELNNLDLGSLGPVFTLAGVDVQAKGVVSADIDSQIKNGQIENLRGSIKAKNLDITAAELKGDRLKTSTLDIDVNLSRRVGTININRLQLKSDWAIVNASGTIPTTFKSFSEFIKPDSAYELKADFKCDLPAVFSQMPQTLGLKEGMQITSGSLAGNIEKITEAGKQKIQGRATLSRLQGTVDGKMVSLSQPIEAQTQISSDKMGIKFDKLDVSSSFAKINCTGSTELMKYNASVNLAAIQAELGQFIDIGRYKIAGELFSEGEVSGSKDKITAVGSSVVKNLRIGSAEAVSASEPKADISFSVRAEPDKGILNVDFIKANASLGELTIKDAVLPFNKKAAKPMDLYVSMNNVDLQKIQPFAVLFASFPKEMQLAGTAESDISIRAENQHYRVITDATHIKNLNVRYPGQKPFEQEKVLLIFDAEVNPTEKTIDVKKLQLISPQIKIHKGQFTQLSKGGKTKLKGRVDCEYDWSAVSTIAAPFLPQGLKLFGKRKDAINFTSEYPTGRTDKLLDNLSTNAKLGFEKAQYVGLNFGPTEVDIQIENGLLKIAPFSTTVNNGQFNFAAEADFKQKPTLLRTPRPIEIAKDIQINDETTRRLLMYLNPIFANSVNVTGVANFNCERLTIPLAAAAKNDIEAIGTISVSKLRLQASDLLGQILALVGTGPRGQDITIRPTRFVLQNGTLRYDNMQMDIGDNPVNFKGAIGLDKSLNMMVTLPYTLSGRTARVGKETLDERILLPLRGTTDKPELDVGKLLEEQLKQRLREGLEELFK